MARLVLPCKGSSFARTSLLGLISSAPVITKSHLLFPLIDWSVAFLVCECGILVTMKIKENVWKFRFLQKGHSLWSHSFLLWLVFYFLSILGFYFLSILGFFFYRHYSSTLLLLSSAVWNCKERLSIVVVSCCIAFIVAVMISIISC